jgi:hypothetical protein
MSEERILALYGLKDRQQAFAHSRFYNHEWFPPNMLHRVGSFTDGDVEELSEAFSTALNEKGVSDENLLVRRFSASDRDSQDPVS